MYRQSNPMRTPPRLLMILPAIVLSSRAVAAEPSSPAKVAIVNAVDLPANLADMRAKLTADLGSAIKQRGFDFMPSATSCVDQVCIKSVAADSGATDVLTVSGSKNEFLGYRIEVRLWNVNTGREERSSPECNTCSASQMIENVVRAAGPLLDRIPELHAAVPPISTTVPPSVGTTAPPITTPPAGRSPTRLALGLSLIGVGVAAGASGIVLWSRDGEPTNCGSDRICPRVYDTRTPGIALTVGGLLAAGAGTAVLLMRPEKRSVAISVTPSTLSIAGTY
jgi:hypothetical protein